MRMQFETPLRVWSVILESWMCLLRMLVSVISGVNAMANPSGMAISKPVLEQTHEEYKKQMSVNGKTSPSNLQPPSTH